VSDATRPRERGERIAGLLMGFGFGLALFGLYYWQVSIPVFANYAERVANAKMMLAGAGALVLLGAFARRAIRVRRRKEAAELGAGAAREFTAGAEREKATARETQ
jgi:hypothetical protein